MVFRKFNKMADDLDGVIYNIRAVIGSSKDPVQLWNLASKFYWLMLYKLVGKTYEIFN